MYTVRYHENFPVPHWHDLVLHFHIPSRQSLLTDPYAAESLIEVKREGEKDEKERERERGRSVKV